MTNATKKICPRILIVDDDPDHCQLVGDSLLMYYDPASGSRIHSVPTGKKCLSEPLEAYDVILLDLHLPDISGLEILDRILEKTDVPVIFVTGEQDSTVRKRLIPTSRTRSPSSRTLQPASCNASVKPSAKIFWGD